MEVTESGDPVTRRLIVDDPTQVGAARRSVSAWAQSLGFDEVQTGRAAIVASEAASNCLRHGRGGELLIRHVHRSGADGLEMVALDRGDGMASSGGPPHDGANPDGSGTGLGAMRRLSSRFEVFSAPGAGTAVLAVVWARPPGPPPEGRLEVGVVCLPKPGEDQPGDDWAAVADARGGRLLVADGLGHGPEARTAASAAVRAFAAAGAEGPAQVLAACHEALRPTRGAAGAIASLDLDAAEVRFAGIGNIAAVLLTPSGPQSMVSYGGIVGQGATKPRELVYPWQPGALLVMSSDGLSTRWSVDSYPGLTARHPSLVAAVLYRDFFRGRDDVTVLVAREAPVEDAP